MFLLSCFDELEKLGAITDEQAEAALEKYEALEKSRPSAGQVGRYATLGALAGPTVGAIGNVVKGRHPLNFSANKRALGVLGESAKGALGMGVVPIVRHHMDREAEKSVLTRYIKEHESQKEAAFTGNTPLPPMMRGGGSLAVPKLAPMKTPTMTAPQPNAIRPRVQLAPRSGAQLGTANTIPVSAGAQFAPTMMPTAAPSSVRGA